MAGCDSCEKNLKAEIGDKDESEMTEQEKAVLAGEQEAPWAYGPLSSWDGDFCEFCHGIGQFGAVFFGVVVWFIFQDFFSSGAGVLAGLIVWIGLAIVVGYVGRFPVLGALFGPIVEKVLALQFDIYVTEKARQEYGAGVRADGGRSEDQPVINEFPIKGAEMHLVAAPDALERCADLEPEVLMRIEVENGAIVDKHNFHPEFNRFRNLRDHVGYFNPNITNVCEAEAQGQGPTTLIQFSELVQQQGEGGIE